MDREANLLLQPDVLLSLAREHLGDSFAVFLAPDIPPRKLRSARATHALSLREGEPIVVLYDASILGGADIGFIATPARLCFRNYFEHPRSLAWDELAQLELTVRGSDIELGPGKSVVPVNQDVTARVCAFLEACCRRRAPGATPYRDPGGGRAPATFAELVIAATRRALGELEWVHYAPSIPPKMARAARVAHAKHLRPEQEILVLYDDTVFGAGNDGFVLTEGGVCWRNFWSTAEALGWHEIDPERIAVDGDMLLLDGDPADERRRIDLRTRPGTAHRAAGAAREIAYAARAGREAAGRAG